MPTLDATLPAIQMDPALARREFLAYRKLLRSGRGTPEDRAIMNAYRLAAKGQRILNLPQAIANGGETTIRDQIWRRRDGRDVQVDVDYRVPMLAIARADAQFVWTPGIDRNGAVKMQSVRLPHHRERARVRELEAGTFPDGGPGTSWGWGPRICAMAPVIPAALRPTHRLENYYLLWEAEWAIDHSVPPGDPALLRHVGGDLYAVLAVWDLTPIEQAVLAGRRPEA